LKFIFSNEGLGDIEGKKVVDIGSRLGAVLYAGYHYSKAAKLVGIEKNNWFFKLQKDFVQKRKMNDRIEILSGDILNETKILADADVIVMNNVFEFFVASPKTLAGLWKAIKEASKKKGCRLVTVPSIETSLADAGINMDISEWVKPITVNRPSSHDEGEQEDYDMISFYEVL